MDDNPFRWVIAILVAAALIGLILFARGEPQHGEPKVAAVAVTISLAA